MALSIPTVDDQRVQQALNSIATQFPLKTQLFATEVITTDKIVKEAITAALIQAEAIQASHIEAGTITATQIKAATITGEKIAADTITAANIAADTITADEIEAGSITATELNVTELSAISANLGTITAGSLDAVTITGTTITGGTLQTAATGNRFVVNTESIRGIRVEGEEEEDKLHFDLTSGILAVSAVVSSETGSSIPTEHLDGQLTDAQLEAISAAKITGELVDAQIKGISAGKVSGELTNAQIESIEAAKLTGQITETQITDDAISTAKIQAGAVTAAEIAANTITAAEIAASAITASELAANAVTSEKILSETIVAGDIKAGTITTTQIAANTIVAADIAAETITGTQIAAGTITATKLNVSTLSAITANLGTVTAGTLEAVTIKASDIEGAAIKAVESFRLSEKKLKLEDNTLAWEDPSETEQESIYGTRVVDLESVVNEHRLTLKAEGEPEQPAAWLKIIGRGDSNAPLSSATPAQVRAQTGTSEGHLVLVEEGLKSSFPQLPSTAKRVINRGSGSFSFSSSGFADTTVSHGLDEAPASFVAFPKVGGTISGGVVRFYGITLNSKGSTSVSLRAQEQLSDTARSGTLLFDWIAMT